MTRLGRVCIICLYITVLVVVRPKSFICLYCCTFYRFTIVTVSPNYP